MFKKIWIVFSISFLLLGALFVFILFESEKPVRYRLASDGVPFAKKLFFSECRALDLSGLDDLHLIGSGYLKFDFLDKKILPYYPQTFLYSIIFMDHNMHFYKGKSLKWYLGIIPAENGFSFRKLHPMRYAVRRWVYGLPNDEKALNALGKFYDSEENILTAYPNVHYKRIASYGWLFEPFYLDDLIKDFETLPEDAAIYFHCARGRGRTTTFMILYDIFKNHDHVALKDIIMRHYCMGGENIYNIDPTKKLTWLPEGLIARKRLIELFYAYMQDKKQGYGVKPWSQWLKETGYIKELRVKKYKYK